MIILVSCVVFSVFIICILFFSPMSYSTERNYSKSYRQNRESEEHTDMLRSIDNRLRESNEIAKRDLNLRINRTYDRLR